MSQIYHYEWFVFSPSGEVIKQTKSLEVAWAIKDKCDDCINRESPYYKYGNPVYIRKKRVTNN